MKKVIRKFLYTALVITMTVLMATVNPLQVFAAGRGRSGSNESKIRTGKTYVKDVIIVTESEACDLDGTAYGDYEVLSTPISDLSGNGHEKLFFAVLTTEDPNEAITDIKAMNMNGDYDFDAYGEYLATVEAWAQAKADTTMTAIKEFKANYKAGKPGAKFAYDMLNYLVGDNEDVPLGEFFVNDAYSTTLGIQVKNLVMKSNLIMLEYVRQLLLVACSDTQETTFVEELLKHGKTNPLINDGSNLYRTAAEDFIYSMGSTSRMINAYRTALQEHGAGLDDYLKARDAEISDTMSENDITSDKYEMAENEGNSIEDIVSGQLLTALFGDVYYIGNDGKTLSLTDILAKDPEAENEADRPTLDMVMPIVALMSEGQRGLAGCGFDKLVGSVINDYSGEDSGYAESFEEIQNMWGDLSDDSLISIYADVDLSLYDPNGIAMVGKSGEFLKSAENGDYSFLGVSTLAAGIMLGGAVVGIAGSCALMKASVTMTKSAVAAQQQLVTQLNGIETKLTQYVDKINEILNRPMNPENFVNYAFAKSCLNDLLDNQSYLSNQLSSFQPSAVAVYMKAFSAFVLVLSVALLIFSVVTLIMNAIHKDDPADYTQIPRILVNAIEKTEYDERQQKTTTTQMIFYKGIIDPFMSDAKAETNKTPSKVMDVFDWSLTDRDREWIALYTTTDGRVGHPIIYDGADNTLVVLSQGNGMTYAAMEQNQGFNGRVNIFNKENYTACGDGIIVFDSDLEVESTTKTGLGASMIISDGKFILFIILAATVGAGIGVGACLLVGKYRKKKEIVSVES